MSQLKTARPQILLVAAAVLLAPLGCAAEVADESSDEDGATSTAAQALSVEPIRVERAAYYSMNHYGQSWKSYDFHLDVENLDYTKEVAIVGRSPAGTWFDIPAQYERSAGNNREIWGAYTGSEVTQFVVRYTVLGQTYWDNNGGNDYTLVGQGQNLFHGINVIAPRPASFGGTSGSLYVAAYVKNLAYSKQVGITYTTDGWATVRTGSLGYQGYDTYGYGGTTSPNAAGVEVWQGAVDIGSASRVDYALSYTVDGQTYWDNNHGANYVVYRQ